jgi:16S rRNA (guanine(966)-N(2))-methyltransferase RsmD
MRITGGRKRNRSLRVRKEVRPTGGRLRESLFSIWSERIERAHFLDLFAGSGSVGLEALSRGARFAVFVERPGRHLDTLEANCRDLGDDRWTIRAHRLGGGTAARRGDPGCRGLAFALRRDLERGAFDLVFADPPYAFDDWTDLLGEIEPILAPEGEVAIEHSSRTSLPSQSGRMLASDSRTYGESSITFYRLINERDA